MAFKELARVDVDELRTLHKKIDEQNQSLGKVSKNIEKGVANLNQAGFQDNKFKELNVSGRFQIVFIRQRGQRRIR